MAKLMVGTRGVKNRLRDRFGLNQILTRCYLTRHEPDPLLQRVRISNAGPSHRVTGLTQPEPISLRVQGPMWCPRAHACTGKVKVLCISLIRGPESCAVLQEYVGTGFGVDASCRANAGNAGHIRELVVTCGVKRGRVSLLYGANTGVTRERAGCGWGAGPGLVPSPNQVFELT